MDRLLALLFCALLTVELGVCALNAAGPEGFPIPAAPADAVEYAAQPIDALAEAFEENGYHAALESAEPEFLRGDRYLLLFSGKSEGRVTIYEYPDSLQAQEDASCMDEWGSALYLPDQTRFIEWKSVPHFYRADNLIIQYIGTDEAILGLLTGLYGEQFAGGDTEPK